MYIIGNYLLQIRHEVRIKLLLCFKVFQTEANCSKIIIQANINYRFLFLSNLMLCNKQES